MNRFITAVVAVVVAVFLLGFGLFGAPSGMESVAVLGRALWTILIIGAVLVVAVAPLRRRMLGRSRLLGRLFAPRLARADAAALSPHELKALGVLRRPEAWGMAAALTRETVDRKGQRVRLWPALAGVELTPLGPAARFANPPGVTAGDWDVARVSSAVGFHVEISPAGASSVLVTARTRDPFKGAAKSSGGSLAAGIPCGVQEDGSPLLASFANQSGAVVGGVPGSGKSAGATSIIAQLCADPAAQFVVIDGKGGSDWSWVAPRAALLNTDDENLEAVKAQLLAVTSLMRWRLQTQKERRGTSNFWHAGATAEEGFVLVVVDECQSFFDPKEHMTKAAKELSQEIAALTVNLVKKGRSAGIFVMSITQKPTSDSIPSALSANCGVKWACRVETRAAEESILGARPDGTPDSASPTLIPETRPGGVTVKRGGEWVRARFSYTPEAEAAAIAERYASLRIPFEQLTARQPVFTEGDDV
ncbi:TraB protein [Microbacterium esteraromaticum]|uniref:TraB protein n=1 Tax=Microbacterium esteraromaticum TaxID=57043 RepID=A0A1R4KNU0_9MICO|nr:hypothetical protein [Microbacterium esteraromaticum]SJN45958.1 TraB protein [Microbacterium esteraromaticum]